MLQLNLRKGPKRVDPHHQKKGRNLVKRRTREDQGRHPLPTESPQEAGTGQNHQVDLVIHHVQKGGDQDLGHHGNIEGAEVVVPANITNIEVLLFVMLSFPFPS